MSRKSQRSASRVGRPVTLRRARASFDSFAGQTVELFTRVMIRAGYSRAALATAVKTTAASIPRTVRPAAQGSRPDFADAGHILTLWAQDPDYLLPDGALRPIPARGGSPSIEALVARVRPRLTFKEGWAQLNRTSTLRSVGRRYVPQDEAIIYLRDRRLLAANTLRFLHTCLQNLEHNFEQGTTEPWYLRTAQHTDFPLIAVEGYLDESIERGMQFLKAEDAVMLRVAKGAPPGQERRRVSVNLFYSVLNADANSGTVGTNHASRTPQRSAGRTKGRRSSGSP
jgi:hypothetical protein